MTKEIKFDQLYETLLQDELIQPYFLEADEDGPHLVEKLARFLWQKQSDLTIGDGNEFLSCEEWLKLRDSKEFRDFFEKTFSQTFDHGHQAQESFKASLNLLFRPDGEEFDSCRDLEIQEESFEECSDDFEVAEDVQNDPNDPIHPRNTLDAYFRSVSYAQAERYVRAELDFFEKNKLSIQDNLVEASQLAIALAMADYPRLAELVYKTLTRLLKERGDHEEADFFSLQADLHHEWSRTGSLKEAFIHITRLALEGAIERSQYFPQECILRARMALIDTNWDQAISELMKGLRWLVGMNPDDNQEPFAQEPLFGVNQIYYDQMTEMRHEIDRERKRQIDLRLLQLEEKEDAFNLADDIARQDRLKKDPDGFWDSLAYGWDFANHLFSDGVIEDYHRRQSFRELLATILMTGEAQSLKEAVAMALSENDPEVKKDYEAWKSWRQTFQKRSTGSTVIFDRDDFEGRLHTIEQMEDYWLYKIREAMSSHNYEKALLFVDMICAEDLEKMKGDLSQADLDLVDEQSIREAQEVREEQEEIWRVEIEKQNPNLNDQEMGTRLEERYQKEYDYFYQINLNNQMYDRLQEQGLYAEGDFSLGTREEALELQQEILNSQRDDEHTKAVLMILAFVYPGQVAGRITSTTLKAALPKVVAGFSSRQAAERILTSRFGVLATGGVAMAADVGAFTGVTLGINAVFGHQGGAAFTYYWRDYARMMGLFGVLGGTKFIFNQTVGRLFTRRFATGTVEWLNGHPQVMLSKGAEGVHHALELLAEGVALMEYTEWQSGVKRMIPNEGALSPFEHSLLAILSLRGASFVSEPIGKAIVSRVYEKVKGRPYVGEEGFLRSLSEGERDKIYVLSRTEFVDLAFRLGIKLKRGQYTFQDHSLGGTGYKFVRLDFLRKSGDPLAFLEFLRRAPDVEEIIARLEAGEPVHLPTVIGLNTPAAQEYYLWREAYLEARKDVERLLRLGEGGGGALDIERVPKEELLGAVQQLLGAYVEIYARAMQLYSASGRSQELGLEVLTSYLFNAVRESDKKTAIHTMAVVMRLGEWNDGKPGKKREYETNTLVDLVLEYFQENFGIEVGRVSILNRSIIGVQHRSKNPEEAHEKLASALQRLPEALPEMVRRSHTKAKELELQISNSQVDIESFERKYPGGFAEGSYEKILHETLLDSRDSLIRERDELLGIVSRTHVDDGGVVFLKNAEGDLEPIADFNLHLVAGIVRADPSIHMEHPTPLIAPIEMQALALMDQAITQAEWGTNALGDTRFLNPDTRIITAEKLPKGAAPKMLFRPGRRLRLEEIDAGAREMALRDQPDREGTDQVRRLFRDWRWADEAVLATWLGFTKDEIGALREEYRTARSFDELPEESMRHRYAIAYATAMRRGMGNRMLASNHDKGVFFTLLRDSRQFAGSHPRGIDNLFDGLQRLESRLREGDEWDEQALQEALTWLPTLREFDGFVEGARYNVRTRVTVLEELHSETALRTSQDVYQDLAGRDIVIKKPHLKCISIDVAHMKDAFASMIAELREGLGKKMPETSRLDMILGIHEISSRVVERLSQERSVAAGREVQVFEVATVKGDEIVPFIVGHDSLGQEVTWGEIEKAFREVTDETIRELMAQIRAEVRIKDEMGISSLGRPDESDPEGLEEPLITHSRLTEILTEERDKLEREAIGFDLTYKTPVGPTTKKRLPEYELVLMGGGRVRVSEDPEDPGEYHIIEILRGPTEELYDTRLWSEIERNASDAVNPWRRWVEIPDSDWGWTSKERRQGAVGLRMAGYEFALEGITEMPSGGEDFVAQIRQLDALRGFLLGYDGEIKGMGDPTERIFMLPEDRVEPVLIRSGSFAGDIE